MKTQKGTIEDCSIKTLQKYIEILQEDLNRVRKFSTKELLNLYMAEFDPSFFKMTKVICIKNDIWMAKVSLKRKLGKKRKTNK